MHSPEQQCTRSSNLGRLHPPLGAAEPMPLGTMRAAVRVPPSVLCFFVFAFLFGQAFWLLALVSSKITLSCQLRFLGRREKHLYKEFGVRVFELFFLSSETLLEESFSDASSETL